MEHYLNIAGGLMIALAFVHLVFPRYFNWKDELRGLQAINRQMMWIHTFFIALVVLLMGILCLSSARELTSTPLGRKLAFGFSLFWTIRLLLQFFGYSSETWKGRRFETTIHIVFSCLWAYFSIVFFLTWLRNHHQCGSF